MPSKDGPQFKNTPKGYGAAPSGSGGARGGGSRGRQRTPQLSEAQQKELKAAFEAEKRRAAILAKVSPADRAKVEQLLQRFGPSRNRNPDDPGVLDLRGAINQVRDMRSRANPAKPPASKPYKKPEAQWKSPSQEHQARRKAVDQRRAQEARERKRKGWKEEFNLQLANVILGPRPTPTGTAGQRALQNAPYAGRRSELLRDPEKMKSEASPAQMKEARDRTNDLFQQREAADRLGARVEATQTRTLMNVKDKTGTPLRSAKYQTQQGIPKTDAGFKQVRVPNRMKIGAEYEVNPSAGNVTERMFNQREFMRRMQTAYKRAAEEVKANSPNLSAAAQKRAVERLAQKYLKEDLKAARAAAKPRKGPGRG